MVLIIKLKVVHVFKWGLFKKDLSDMHLPDQLKGQMKSIYSDFKGSDRVVLVMDQLSEAIREQKIELDEKLLKIDELESQLEQTYRAKSLQADLLISMCDEIQAPIHTINQLGDWLDQTHLDPSQRACFDFYRKTARKLNGIFNDIIDVAKLREGVFQLDPISFQLNEVVREIMQTLILTAQDKGIPLTVTIDPDVPQYLIGDIKRLEQILVSLVNNAIKFTYEGEVQVLVQKGADDPEECTVNFLVLDSGMGIPENQIETIFDRLAQGDPDVERNYGGTGLGLYICKCFVEQMGGAIWVENNTEGGATFGFSVRFEKGSMSEIQDAMLHLPAPVEPEETDAGEASAEEENSEGSIASSDEASTEEEYSGNSVASEECGENNRMKILVVDDCEDTCRLIEKFLEQGPYDVDVANDGVVAIEMHDDAKYDLILMDIQLPRLDGVGATMEIRDREFNKKNTKTPIFALVGDPGEDNDGYYQAGDFDQCLIKPVSKSDLLEAISKLNPPQ